MEAIKTMEEAASAVANEVKQEVKEAVAVVEKAAERLVQEISLEEKFSLRNIENEFLKAQAEITRLQTVLQNSQRNFTNAIEEMSKKYVINPAEFLFDTVSLQFKKK